MLVLLDDVQWVDAESTAALLFAARRLHHDRIAFVLALRAGGPPTLDGVDVVTVGDLSVPEAQEPWHRTSPAPSSGLVDRLGGNPLALLEAAGRLTPAQRRGAAPLPDPLPVGDRLELVYEPLLAGLSAPAWRALLCAAGPEGGQRRAGRALRRDGIDAEAALDEAEEHGVLVRDHGGLGFRHPLLRRRPGGWPPPPSAGRPTAPWPAPSPATPPGRPGPGTWPRRPTGPTTPWPTSWSRSPRSTAPAGGSRPLGRPGARRPASRRPRPIGRAAGRRRRRRLPGRRRRAGPGPGRQGAGGPASRAARAQVLSTLGVLEQYAGSVPAAELLATAADLAEGPQRVWALAELGHTRFRLNDLAGLAEFADRLAEAADPGDPGQRAGRVHARGRPDGRRRPGRGRPLLADVLELLRSPALRDDPRYLIHLGLAAGFLGDPRGLVARPNAAWPWPVSAAPLGCWSPGWP